MRKHFGTICPQFASRPNQPLTTMQSNFPNPGIQGALMIEDVNISATIFLFPPISQQLRQRRSLILQTAAV
jgi:hypothetical protein